MKPRSDETKEEVFEYIPEPTTIKRNPALPAALAQAREGLDDKPSPHPLAAQEMFAKREAASGVVGKRRNYETLSRSAAATSYEPPDQKLVKLQAEVSDMLRMVELTTAKEGEMAADCLGLQPADMVSELKILEKRLLNLAKEGATSRGSGDQARNIPIVASPGPLAVPGALMSQLDVFAAGSMVEKVKPAGSEEKVIYEISYAPSTRSVTEVSKIATLESTVAEIEKQLGRPELGSTCLGDLHGVVSSLQKRVDLMDEKKVEAVSTRVKTVMADMDKLLAAKAKLEGQTRDDETAQKINQLYEFCHGWSSAASSLPSIVARLRSLQALHQQSASFSTRLTALEQQQDELVRLLESTNTAVVELGTGLQENMSIIRDNMKELEQKMSQLMKKHP